MSLHLLAPTLAIVAGAIDEGRSSPNNGAAIAGFVLLLLWIAVVVVQVLRRRRQAATDPADTTAEPSASGPEGETDPRSADTS